MEHTCFHENEWGQMNQVIKGLVKQIYGNGQKGMAFAIPEMQTSIHAMTIEMGELKTAVSGVLKYVSSSEGFEAGQKEATERHEKLESVKRHKTQITVAGILGFASIVVTLIIKFA